MPRPALLQKVISYLRAGYPEGVPEQDYVPLFALLARHLTEDEVTAVAAELANGSAPRDGVDVRDAIARVTNEMPLESDVARVQARLAAGGWPLAPAADLG